jgi:hypothetical protein
MRGPEFRIPNSEFRISNFEFDVSDYTSQAKEIKMRYLFAIVTVLPMIFAGCGAGSDTPEPESVPAEPPMTEGETQTIGMGGKIGGLETDINLDPEIAEAWSGVRVQVLDSETAESEVFDVALGETVTLGESGLTLTASTFIPDFVMDETGITSRSGDTHNPAALILISEEGVPDYEGWLFAAMPEIHPYPHDRYQVLLVEGIPAAGR